MTREGNPTNFPRNPWLLATWPFFPVGRTYGTCLATRPARHFQLVSRTGPSRPVIDSFDLMLRRAVPPIWVLTGALGLLGCASTAATVAPEPRVEVKVEQSLVGTVALDLSDVPQAEVCSATSWNLGLCVSRFRDAYRSGLDDLLDAFVARGNGPRYTAAMRLLELYHFPDTLTSLGQGTFYHVEIRWQFVLKDNQGNTPVAVTQTTRSPRPLRNAGDAEAVVRALIEQSLRDVAGALNAGSIPAPSAAR